jgi:UDP-N-acetyl-D-galactosamine dehydrogenase
MGERIAVVGLGYVGLPVALAFSRQFPGTVGFDTNTRKVAELREGRDQAGNITSEELLAAPLDVTCDPRSLRDCSFFVIAVPTPIDRNRKPDLGPLASASELVGQALAPGSVVVIESTVYPGVTEEFCAPILERVSGLRTGTDFKMGYSPERINPGDREHTLERVVKVVAGEDAEALERVAAAYERIIGAGVHRAPSIKVAEAAKVIENTQRDLNISLMNELAIIFDRLGLCTNDVLEAARTKWNFLPFTPGLVGGHCISVDPYYLTSKAEEVGYHPQVILSGRRINDGMGAFVAQKVVKLLLANGKSPCGSRVAILGLTFKENVPDIRNSRVPDIAAELSQFGVAATLHDPLVAPEDARAEYGLELSGWSEMENLDALVLAVPHSSYLERLCNEMTSLMAPDGVLVDVKGALRGTELPPSLTYWSL